MQTLRPSELQRVFPKNETIFLHKHSAIIPVRNFNIITVLNNPYLEFMIVPMTPFIVNLNFGSRPGLHLVVLVPLIWNCPLALLCLHDFDILEAPRPVVLCEGPQYVSGLSL